MPFVRENFVLITLAILGTNLGMALFRSPTVAYLGDLFKPGERSKANGVINLMGGGGALALFFGGALYKIGVPLPFIVGAGVMLIAIGIVVAFVKEPDLSDQPTGEREPGLWANVKHVATDRDRSGLFLLAAIFAWFVGWNATEAFFTLYAAQRARRGSGHRRADADRLRGDADHLCDPQRPPGDAHRAQADDPDRAGWHDARHVGRLPGAQPDDAARCLGRDGQVAFWAFVNINSLPMVYDLAGQRSIGSSPASTTSHRRWPRSPAPSWPAG